MANNGLPRKWTVEDSLDLYSIQQWGNGYFSVNEKGNLIAQPGGPGTAAVDIKELVDEVRRAASRCRCSSASPTSSRARGRRSTRLSAAPSRSTATRRPTAASTRSRSTRTATSSRGCSRPAGPTTTASRPAPSPSCSPSWHARGRGSRDHLQRLQGRGVHRDRAARLEARPTRDPRRREVLRAAADPRGRRAHRRPADRSASAPASRRAAPATGRPRAATARSSGSARAGSSRRSSSCASAACSTGSSCSTSTSAARSPRSATSRTRCARRGGSTSSSTSWARRSAYLDVGGGLGVDYDGSQTNFASSMNYTLQEYANDVVFGTMELCDADGVPAPDHRHGVGPRAGRAPRRAGHRRPRRRRVHGRPAARQPARGDTGADPLPPRHLPRGLAQEPARDLPRRGRVPRRGALAVQPRPPVARAARARRGPVLGAVAEDPAHGPRAARRARGARGARAAALRHLLLQLLDVPVAARRVGDRPAVPDLADPPAQRGADAARECSPTSPATPTARSTASSICATSSTCSSCTHCGTRTTTSASSWSAPTRRSSATCTTCSATPTPCT